MVFSATACFYPAWKASRLTTVPDMRLPGNEGARGSKKENSKYLRVQGGVLYQFTVRVKLSKEASGGGMGFDD